MDVTTPLNYKFSGSIFQLFDQKAKEFPNHIAIVSNDGICTYRDLEEISSKLAGYLHQQGIGPGGRVAIYSNRNAALVYALLGVSKSGAAFFILDSEYPSSYILKNLEFTKPHYLIVCGNTVLPKELEIQLEGKIFRLFSKASDALRSLQNIEPIIPYQPSQEDEAYYSFTSGSTGKPKCIINTHGPLNHFIEWHIKHHKLSQNDRFSFLSGLSHDPALRDIFTPLSLGATLFIPNQSTLLDPFELAQWLQDHSINVLHLTPSLGSVIAANPNAALDKIRYFFWGGETLSPKISKQIFRIAPNGSQVNFYGSTETPQAMSYFAIDSKIVVDSFPIGKGIDDVQILVVANRKLGKENEVGEIVIRTPYLSRGYLNDPDQTHLRYIANPITGNTNDRCYKTGDQGKYLPNNDVVFVGRTDHQIKVRGFRVELDEIIHKIEEEDEVSRAIVIAKDFGRASKFLVAYYTSNPQKSIESQDLHKRIQEKLPPYMVPNYFVKLEKFPLLPNGKIDLQSLPLPEMKEREEIDTSAYSEREKDLIKIWEEILGIKNIGIHDRFVDLGGDSLSAINALIKMHWYGIDEKYARGVLQGKTIAQIVKEETEGVSIEVERILTDSEKTNLLVNISRGLLVTLVVFDHWMPALLQRIPFLAPIKMWLSPFINFATPGFAFVFGMTLGYNFFPFYLKGSSQFYSKIKLGLGILGSSIIISTLLEFYIRSTHQNPESSILVLYGPLFYYFLAMLTASLWFKFIALFRSKILGCLILGIGFYLAYLTAQHILLSNEQSGVFQLARLMSVAKFSYFNMTFGSLFGVGLGIYLYQNPISNRNTLFAAAGLFMTLCGLAILRYTHGDFALLFSNGDDMGLWRWITYGGLLLILISIVSSLLEHFETLSSATKKFLTIVGVEGQCSILIFVLSTIVIQLKMVLNLMGVPNLVGFAIVFSLFFGITSWAMTKTYRLFYGK